MAKKGFDYEECYLTFNGEVFAIAENKKNAQVIGETLIQLFNENEQLYELINFANTLIAFKTSEFCQTEWEKRLKELESE